MSILRIRDASGNFVAIPSIKGEKGDKGDAGSVTAVNGIAPDGSGNVALGAVHPRNLLDNSDFMNPVNQRGKTSYSEAGYTIDRWKNSYTAELSITSGGIHLSCTSENQWLVQSLSDEVWKTLKGKAFTIAACTDDGSIYVSTGTMPAGTDSYDSSQIRMGSSGYLVNLYKSANGRPMARIFSRDQGSEVTLRWAALYEGTYTSDTLPPYVPKGRAVELAECMRYYYQSWNGGDISTFGIITGEAVTSIRLESVELPEEMRVVPTITYYTSDGTSGAVKRWVDNAVVEGMTSVYANKKRFIPSNADGGLTAGDWYGFHYAASADL